MRRVCTRYSSPFRHKTVYICSCRTLSSTFARYANEGTSPKAKALEVYQVPKSNIAGRSVLTQPSPGLREQPRWLLQIAMKLFRVPMLRKATMASTAKNAICRASRSSIAR